MSYLQINKGMRSQDDLDQTGLDITQVDETLAALQRKATYEGLRQRDAWLRKPWGPKRLAANLQ